MRDWRENSEGTGLNEESGTMTQGIDLLYELLQLQVGLSEQLFSLE
jgi:hypothetical protein